MTVKSILCFLSCHTDAKFCAVNWSIWKWRKNYFLLVHRAVIFSVKKQKASIFGALFSWRMAIHNFCVPVFCFCVASSSSLICVNSQPRLAIVCFQLRLFKILLTQPLGGSVDLRSSYELYSVPVVVACSCVLLATRGCGVSFAIFHVSSGLAPWRVLSENRWLAMK